ncbi:MAG TPA: hypothetical protein VGL05_19315 [Kribbella sp.]
MSTKGWVTGDSFQCGWCGGQEVWAPVSKGRIRLDGGWGLYMLDGVVIIAVEVTDTFTGETGGLPHRCPRIPPKREAKFRRKMRELGVEVAA